MNKLIDNLPYIVSDLEKKGQYAHIVKKESKSKNPSTKTPLKIKRYLSLCDAPSIWDKIPSGEEKPIIFLGLRIFCTSQIAIEYLNCKEYVEYCKDKDITPLTYDQLTALNTIKEEDYPEHEALIAREYSKSLDQKTVSISDVEEVLEKVRNQDKSKKSTKKNLSRQYAKIQSCPSKVLDVSSFGKTMDKTYGKVLDKIRDKTRIKRCISIAGFPVISDNIQSFERAMNMLGPQYSAYVAMFRDATSTSFELSNKTVPESIDAV